MIGQAGGHGRGPWLPLFDCARPMDGLGQWQWQTQARVRQHEIVVYMVQSQLLTQARFVFAPRVDAPPDGRDMLAKVQIQALDKRRIDLPSSLGQHRLDGLSHAEHDPVLDPYEASTPIRLDDLGIEQLGLWPPARLGLGACGLAALGWHPLAIMRDERGEVRPKAVG